MNTKFTLTALIAVLMLCICYISYVHVGLESVIKYIKNSNETSLLTWDQNKTLDTAHNTNIFYLEKNKNKYSGCWKLAEILDIKYSNKHWQVMELPRATLFLYAAYLDTRIVLPVIRIMASVKGKIQEPFLSLYCKVWFEDNSDPVIVNVTDYQPVERDPYYFINCGLEESLNGKIPAVVSLVETPCLAVPTNSIRGD